MTISLNFADCWRNRNAGEECLNLVTITVKFLKQETLNGVKMLGYIKTRDKNFLSFSLLINGYLGSVDQIKAEWNNCLEPG